MCSTVLSNAIDRHMMRFHACAEDEIRIGDAVVDGEHRFRIDIDESYRKTPVDAVGEYLGWFRGGVAEEEWREIFFKKRLFLLQYS